MSIPSIFPKAKILSPDVRNATQTVNVIVSDNGNKVKTENKIEQSERIKSLSSESEQSENRGLSSLNESNPYANFEDLGGVRTRDVQLEQNTNEMTDKDKNQTIEFLRLIIEAYRNNPIKYNDYLICTETLLCNLITTLTRTDEVSVVLSDIDELCGCTSNNKHKLKVIPISKIWVRNGDNVELFKYKYASYLQYFEQFGISLKFVYSE